MLGCSIELLRHREWGRVHERRIDRVAIDVPPVLPPSIDEVYEEGIRVCAPLEMSDRYHFHSLQRPRLKLSDQNGPRASQALA
jgi:hypothetical protein